jgi:hypothetical protein
MAAEALFESIPERDKTMQKRCADSLLFLHVDLEGHPTVNLEDWAQASGPARAGWAELPARRPPSASRKPNAHLP